MKKEVQVGEKKKTEAAALKKKEKVSVFVTETLQLNKHSLSKIKKNV